MSAARLRMLRVSRSQKRARALTTCSPKMAHWLTTFAQSSSSAPQRTQDLSFCRLILLGFRPAAAGLLPAGNMLKHELQLAALAKQKTLRREPRRERFSRFWSAAALRRFQNCELDCIRNPA